eukprot:16449426-Heterocapsa_arctica.AAC.1
MGWDPLDSESSWGSLFVRVNGSAMQIRVLPVRDQPAVDERHHVMDARLVINDHVYVRGSCFKNLNCRVELRPSCGLFRSWDHSVTIEWVPLLHPHSPTGPSPSVVLWVRCTSIRVRLDWVVYDFRGRLIHVKWSSYIQQLWQPSQPEVLSQRRRLTRGGIYPGYVARSELWF